MKARIDTKNKSSAKKKLIPAAGSLLISAAMLSTSTYAWFTMSREVEVKNIQMTASVPEDLQISLGKLTDIKGQGSSNPNATEISAGSYTGLQGNQGRLFGTTSADDGGVDAPANDGTAIDNLFWSNTADISEYYRLGKIIPASSIDGEKIFFTPDASGNGTTLKADAKFYQVADLAASDFSTIYKWNSTSLAYATDGTGDEARTKLHAITNVTRASDTWNPANGENTSTNGYVGAKAWNDTQDDGYYVDIPIWIRSSAKDDTALSVDAFVTTNAAKTNDGSEADDDELYLAARAAIIYGSTADSTNLLRIRKDSFTSTNSVTNFMYSTNNTGDAVASVASYVPTYGDAVEYDGSAFLTVPGRDESDATKKYGTMVKAVVRVWLEGEDPNCWNPNAGQDFNISLKFVKGAIGYKVGDTEANIAKNANGVAFPADYAKGNAANAANLAVDASTIVTITSTTKNGDADGTLKFQFNGLTGDAAKWNMIEGSFEKLDGWTYQITGNSKTAGTVTGADGIAAWLKTNVLTKDDASKTYTITETDNNAPAGG